MSCTIDRYAVRFDTRADAAGVRERMYEIADTYGRATAVDLYDLVGISCKWIDRKFYWTIPMLRNSKITLEGDGYFLKLPEPLFDLTPNNDDKKTIKPQPVYVTINRDVHENVEDVLKPLFKQVTCVPGREFHITIE